MIFNVGAGGGASTADKVKYNNTESGLQSDNVQGAVDELNNSLPKFKYGIAEITLSTNSNGDGEVIFDSPFRKVPIVLGNIVDPACAPVTDATGVNFHSITQNGFMFRLTNSYRTNLTIKINWVAMEF